MSMTKRDNTGIPNPSAIIVQHNSEARIPCAFCLHTINGDDLDEASRQIVVTSEGLYFHVACLTNMEKPPDTRPTHLPSVLPLPAIVREPISISAEISNSLVDKPLGISESRIYLKHLEMQEFVIRNNDNNNLLLIPSKAAPWLHVEIAFEANAVNTISDRSGHTFLKPQELAYVVLRPHPIRPTRQRYRLYLSPENYLVVYSNGMDVLVWIASGILLLAGVLLWSAFTSLGNLISNLDIIARVEPLRIITTLLSFYLYSTLIFTVVTSLMPTRILWLIRGVLYRVKNLRLFSDAMPRILEVLDMRLAGGRLSFQKNNISKLIFFFIVFSLLISLPWAVIISALTFLFVKILMLGWLFYAVCFLASLYLFFLYLKSYDLVRDLSIDESIERLRSEIANRLDQTKD
jgi:hypothetical protein